MDQTLRDLYQSLNRNIAGCANKENMDTRELEMCKNAVETMAYIKKIEKTEHEMNGSNGYSERYGYGYGVSYPGHQQWPMSYGDEESYRRSRNAMGQFTSNDGRSMGNMGNGYSGHSFNDRMIAQLEAMYPEAPSEEERNRLREEIERLRRSPM